MDDFRTRCPLSAYNPYLILELGHHVTYRGGSEDWYLAELPPRAPLRPREQERVDSIVQMVHRKSQVTAVHSSRSSSTPKTPPKEPPHKKARPETKTLTARKSRGSVGQMLQQPQALPPPHGSVGRMLQKPAGPPPVVLTPASRCKQPVHPPSAVMPVPSASPMPKPSVRPRQPVGAPPVVMPMPSASPQHQAGLLPVDSMPKQPALPKNPAGRLPARMMPKQPALPPKNAAGPLPPSARSSTSVVEVASGAVEWEVESTAADEYEQAVTSKSPVPPTGPPPPWKLPPWRLPGSPRSRWSEEARSSRSEEEVEVVAGDGVEEGESDEECLEDDVLAEWLSQGAWVCDGCMSTNMRFVLVCSCCMEWRGDVQTMQAGDWRCEDCHNLNFAHREKCFWLDCPTNDWTCPCCSNKNFGRRLKCNAHNCYARRPASAAPEASVPR